MGFCKDTPGCFGEFHFVFVNKVKKKCVPELTGQNKRNFNSEGCIFLFSKEHMCKNNSFLYILLIYFVYLSD